MILVNNFLFVTREGQCLTMAIVPKPNRTDGKETSQVKFYKKS